MQIKKIIFIIIILIKISFTYQFICNFNDYSWKRKPRLIMNQRQVLAPTAHGFSLIVDSSDQIVSQKILETGSWQPFILTIINKFVRENNTILNLGSQTGFEAILMGNIIGNGGKMFIFQPYSVSYKIAVKNIYLNGLNKISRIYRMGAGRNRQNLKLWIDSYNTGHSSLIIDSSHNNKNYEQIQIDRVDDIIDRNKIDFALIDIEKYEVNALLGMKNILIRSKSLIAIIQWRYLDNQNRDKESTQQLLHFLEEYNYNWYRYYPEKNPCQFGRIQMIDSKQLLTIKEEDLILIAQNADLSHLLSS